MNDDTDNPPLLLEPRAPAGPASPAPDRAGSPDPDRPTAHPRETTEPRLMQVLRPPDTARWGSLPLSPPITGRPEALLARIPEFEQLNPRQLGLEADNYTNLVVRTPAAADERPAVVGLVSNSYQLIQHRTVFDRTLAAAGKVPGAVLDRATLQLTTNGARAMVRVDLGTNFEVGPDTHPVRLELVSFNSVDGGAALLVRLGWCRLICANGLAIGLGVSKTRLAHVPGASIDDVFDSLKDQLAIAATDRDTMLAWAGTRVSPDHLRSWIDGPVLERWNSLSAARVWHICMAGRDAGFVPPFERQPPTRRNVRRLGRVPGAAVPADTVYSVAQALSWVASRRTDLEEARAAQAQIPALMEALKQ